MHDIYIAIYIVGSHNIAMASEDKLRRFSVCCGEKLNA
jgi:hypothetical protein